MQLQVGYRLHSAKTWTTAVPRCTVFGFGISASACGRAAVLCGAVDPIVYLHGKMIWLLQKVQLFTRSRVPVIPRIPSTEGGLRLHARFVLRDECARYAEFSTCNHRAAALLAGATAGRKYLQHHAQLAAAASWREGASWDEKLHPLNITHTVPISLGERERATRQGKHSGTKRKRWIVDKTVQNDSETVAGGSKTLLGQGCESKVKKH